MKQALLMNPDTLKDLLSGSPGPAPGSAPSPQQSHGSSHSHFTSRRDWQAVTVSPCSHMIIRIFAECIGTPALLEQHLRYRIEAVLEAKKQ